MKAIGVLLGVLLLATCAASLFQEIVAAHVVCPRGLYEYGFTSAICGIVEFGDRSNKPMAKKGCQTCLKLRPSLDLETALERIENVFVTGSFRKTGKEKENLLLGVRQFYGLFLRLSRRDHVVISGNRAGPGLVSLSEIVPLFYLLRQIQLMEMGISLVGQDLEPIRDFICSPSLAARGWESLQNPKLILWQFGVFALALCLLCVKRIKLFLYRCYLLTQNLLLRGMIRAEGRKFRCMIFAEKIKFRFQRYILMRKMMDAEILLHRLRRAKALSDHNRE